MTTMTNVLKTLKTHAGFACAAMSSHPINPYTTLTLDVALVAIDPDKCNGGEVELQRRDLKVVVPFLPHHLRSLEAAKDYIAEKGLASPFSPACSHGGQNVKCPLCGEPMFDHQTVLGGVLVCPCDVLLSVVVRNSEGRPEDALLPVTPRSLAAITHAGALAIGSTPTMQVGVVLGWVAGGIAALSMGVTDMLLGTGLTSSIAQALTAGLVAGTAGFVVARLFRRTRIVYSKSR